VGPCSYLVPVVTEDREEFSGDPLKSHGVHKKKFGKWCSKAVTGLSAHHAQALCGTCYICCCQSVSLSLAQ
jgi:hypothetical protein